MLVILIFAVNVYLGRPVVDSFMFALALTPGSESHLTLATSVAMARGFDANLRILSFGDPDDLKTQQWRETTIGSCLERGMEQARLALEIKEKKDVAHDLIREAGHADILVMGASRDWVDQAHLLGALPDRVAEEVEKTVVIVKGEELKIMTLVRRTQKYFPDRLRSKN